MHNKIQKTSPPTLETIASRHVGDSFNLHVHGPSAGENLPVLIYLDAQLPTGRWIGPLVQKMCEEKKLPPLLTVGIAHQKSLFRKRNRDFIPPPRKIDGEFKSRRKNYGQAAAFHSFLTKELLPWLRDRYPVKEDWALAGHSLGGLFALYALLQPQSPFQKLIALSPSVWINRRSILRIGQQASEAGQSLESRLYLAAGGLEEFNLILPGMRAFEKWATGGNHPGLALKSEALPWKNHFTVVRPGMRRGLEWVYSEK